MNKYSFFIVVLLFARTTIAVLSQRYTSDLQYLPQNVTYDSTIPLPETVLGSPVGEWHVRHDQLLQYLYLLAEKSPRIAIKEIGRSHEIGRSSIYILVMNVLCLIWIRCTKPISTSGGRLIPKEANNVASNPLVLWMGYSIPW